ncbi:ATP synthase F1 subunit delta [Bizionia argentinensis JUB59]|uniref:ATP synthase subunit delta n=1 Tax=Bizionia argentinensis JUB59 TaxID=1046627 RepID=G2EEV2_9FLAO|nr:ATP synthase F1 subunit delta [Bizionia argentinensis]EGV43042.2 ATP synthase F1 subunit delta [Bizionia argentinensis JUB59]
MAGTRAAIRYAKAVLSLATDKQVAEAINTDMVLIAKTLKDNQNLDEALKNAVVRSEAKKAILLQVFPDTHPMTIELFKVLDANKRLDIMDAIADKYTELFDIQNGKQSATVTTAVPLTKDIEIKVLTKIKELTNKAVTVKNIVDEDILGGFILRVGDIQYNASIASKLNKLKREFTTN